VRRLSLSSSNRWFVGTALAFLVAWELGVRTGILDPLFFSSPTEIAGTAADEFGEPRFWTDVRTTATEVLLGFLAAVAAGIPLGLLVGSNRWARYLLGPWIEALNATPQIAFLPLVVLIVGIGTKAAVVIAFITVLFAVAINTEAGVRTVPVGYLKLARSFCASRLKTYASVVLPATLPYVAAGLRIGLSRALITVFVAEIFAGTTGLGYIIKLGGQTLQTDRVFFGILVFNVLGLTLFALVHGVEKRFAHWRSTGPARGAAAHG
jgi:ABC-type nitrate/sulfonate/bicarbonate transport system permease component